jgi:hypothetical protein
MSPKFTLGGVEQEGFFADMVNAFTQEREGKK